MSWLSVAEVAKRLGVGVQRVHQRIADGSLPAERVGSQWVIDEVDILPLLDKKGPGRPLSPRSSWALIALAVAEQPEVGAQGSGWIPWLGDLAATERSRAKNRLDDLLAVLPVDASSHAYVEAVPILASQLRFLLGNRAARRLYRASPRDLDEIRGDERIVLAGLSHPRSGIASGEIVEAYVAAEHLDDLVEHHLLDEFSRSIEANVILHVVGSVGVIVGRLPVESPLLLAADLAEHRRPREEARGADLIRGLAEIIASRASGSSRW